MIHRGQVLPENIKASLDAYAKERRPVGGFLTAVLSDQLHLACAKADEDNIKVLAVICCYVYNEMPAPCWGSPEAVAAWLKPS